jgi:hypothetical protein
VPLTLISPSGVRYTRDAPGNGVVHDAGPTWEQYEIGSPEPGEWHFELFGKDVNPGGEPVTVLPTTEPPANLPPTATISYAVNSDGTLTFASAQSSDSDGQIARREWYVSSGSDQEVYTAGDSVTVAKGSGGKNVTLVVTDDRGDTSFAVVGFVKTTAVLLVWVAATVVVVACVLSGFLGRASWGDGEGPSVSGAGIAGLVAVACVAVVLAAWLTRLLSRRG